MHAGLHAGPGEVTTLRVKNSDVAKMASSSAAAKGLLIRVGSKAGTWRLAGVSPDDLFLQLKQRIEAEHGVPTASQQLSRDRAGKETLDDSASLADTGLAQNGQMLYVTFPEDLAAGGTKKTVQKDGTIVQAEGGGDAGFRPGMRPLRSIKMHWNLSDFCHMDDQYNFYIKKGERKLGPCSSLALDNELCNDFQNYMRRCDADGPFSRCRCGFLFGKFLEDGKVQVDVMYELPQEGTDGGGFELYEDEHEERADAVAEFLGYERVGIMIAHPPRAKGHLLTGAEIKFTAEQNIEVGADKPFVVVTCTLNEDGNADFQGYQVSDQCLAMVDAGALLESTDPTKCQVHETFTALVEMKPETAVDNAFFTVPVAVTAHDSGLRCAFPRTNREGSVQTQDEIGAHLRQFASEPFVKRISDYHLLIFLCNFLDQNTDIKQICASVSQGAPIEEGFELIISTMAESG